MVRTGKKAATDHDVVLTTDALLLRAFQLEDAEAIYEAVVDSKHDLQRWLPWCHEAYAIGDTIEFLKGRGEAFQTAGERAFAIVERATGSLVGSIGINQLDNATRRANLGYWLRTSATGRGYAATATRLLARWAFETLELDRIEIVVAAGNERSQRVAERVGATREGIARKRLRCRDVQHDAVIFSLVRDDVLKENR